MKKILQFKLRILAKLIILRQKPKIIAISGSVGKTSAKNAICQVLKNKYRVSGGLKNYNNEIGLPLSIIGSISAKKNIFAWFKIFAHAFRLILLKSNKYPEILVLEMGVDRPGDMNYLCKIAKPKIGIITAIGHSHIEYFGSLEKIKEEKQNLIKHLPMNGLSVLNGDDNLSSSMSAVSRCQVVKYGFSEGVELRAQDLKYNLERGNYEISGLNFKFNYRGSIVPVVMDNVISKTAVYAALAAAAVGLYYNYNLVDIAASLKDFSLPPGRMSVLSGINHSFIIDDSYNSSPESCKLAIEIFKLAKIEINTCKYAILGDMLEIGNYTEVGHREIGKLIANSDIDNLLLIGDKAKIIGEEANKRGMAKKNIIFFENQNLLINYLQEHVKAGDVMLFKASRGIALEKVIKELMSEPDKADELLV